MCTFFNHDPYSEHRLKISYPSAQIYVPDEDMQLDYSADGAGTMDQEFSDPNSSPQEERGVSGEAVSFSKAIASTPSEQLSFERYSAARTSTELERRKSEDVTVSGRHPSTGLASLTIDPTRIDSHLVALYDADPSAAQQYRKLAVRLISLVATRPSKRPSRWRSASAMR